MDKLNYKTYSDLLADIKTNLYKLPRDIDLVVGIPRSGMIPAYMIGFALNARVCSLDEFINGNVISHGTRPIKDAAGSVLIVDDSVDSGSSMRLAKEKIEKTALNCRKVSFAAIYANPGAERFVDIVFTVLPQPRMFQWNYLNHGWIEQSCFDIDGVLCVDPTEAENDDGEKYRAFLRDAKPLYIPRYKIYALVTSRLEKYRGETEEWLAKHGARYERLYMLDLPSKEERIRLNMHAKFKAKVYKELRETSLFYESETSQARQIARLTKKAVFCVATDELINRSINFAGLRLPLKQRLKKLVKKTLRMLIPVTSWRRMLKKIYHKMKQIKDKTTRSGQ